MSDFADIADEFHQRVSTTIWATLATVDTAGRPRTRIVHPVWDGPNGWMGTRSGTLKVRHLEQTPYVSFMYWDPRHQQVSIDATATVCTDLASRQEAWRAMAAPDEPYGYDPATIWPAGAEDDGFTAVRLVANRVTIFAMPPIIWTRPTVD